MQVKDCVFCKIVKDEIDSWTVYEDNLVQAFLDVNPVSEGHTLIIPKQHYENIYEITKETLARIVVITKKLAEIYINALNVKAVNILHASGKNAQQSVFHFHMHLVPRHANDGLNHFFPPQQKNEINLKKTLQTIKKHILHESV